MKAKAILIILTLFLTGQMGLAQGWELDINVLPIKDHGNKIIIDDNGDYLVSGWSYDQNEDNPVTTLSRISSTGEELWTKTYYNTEPDSLDLMTGGMVKASDGGYLMAGTTFDEQPHNLMLLKIDENGDTLWTKKHELPSTEFSNYAIRDITNTSDGGYALIGGLESSDSSLLIKLNSTADVEWMEVIALGTNSTRAHALLESADGNLVIAGSMRNNFTSDRIAFIQKRDLEGTELWTYDYDGLGSNFYHKTGLKETEDGGFIIAEGSKIFKTNSDGILEWEHAYSLALFTAIDQTMDGGYILTGVFKLTQNLLLMKTDANGDLLWYKLFGGPINDAGLDVIEDSDGSIVVTGTVRYNNDIADGGDLYVIKTNSSGNLFDNVIKGKLFRDENLSCTDDNESGMNLTMVEVIGSNDTLYTFTNPDGEYEISLDTGSYEIRSILPNIYWGTCIDSPYPFEVTNAPDTVMLDLPAQVLIECPYLEVDIGAPLLRRCFNSAYWINYCNSGTAIAEDAVITVILDPYLEYISSSIDLDFQNGDTLEFEIGDIEMGECGTFNITTYLNCDSTVLGQSHCVTALITPDSICVDLDSLWDGSSLEVDALCTGDSIFFYIENIGEEDMLAPRGYIVTEDVIMYNQGDVQLLSGESIEVLAMEANGATWRLEVDQAEGHPGNSNPSVVVEGCVPDNNLFNLYFTNAFPQDDGNPFISIDCRESVGSFDPNDKHGFPTGWSGEHFIERNEDLEYLIRFQNTGTDTAFTVVIEDQISPTLDIASIQAGASSHTYRLGFNANNTLVFTFDQIMLPDSNVNEAASHGFVKFKIKQQRDLALGTVIYNQAAIFFDFNEAVITNQTFHTIAEPLITVAVGEVLLPNVEVLAYPNPFKERTTIVIEGFEGDGLQLQLYDVNGYLLSTQNTENNQFILNRNGLNQGMYFYQIVAEGQLIGVGKLIAH